MPSTSQDSLKFGMFSLILSRGGEMPTTGKQLRVIWDTLDLCGDCGPASRAFCVRAQVDWIYTLYFDQSRSRTLAQVTFAREHRRTFQGLDPPRQLAPSSSGSKTPTPSQGALTSASTSVLASVTKRPARSFPGSQTSSTQALVMHHTFMRTTRVYHTG